MMPLHTPGLISQISETFNEINAKKIRIIIILKTPDYPVLVFSPHTSTQNMQINNAHRNYYNGEKIVFYKLSGGGGDLNLMRPNMPLSLKSTSFF